jgi:hypothetical protein
LAEAYLNEKTIKVAAKRFNLNVGFPQPIEGHKRFIRSLKNVV